MSVSSGNIPDDSAADKLSKHSNEDRPMLSAYEKKFPVIPYHEKALNEDVRHKFPILSEDDLFDKGFKGYLHSIERCPSYFIVAALILSTYCLYDIFFWNSSPSISGTDIWEYQASLANSSEKSRVEGLYVAIESLNQELIETEILSPRTVLEPSWETHIIFEMKSDVDDIFDSKRIIRMRQIINNIKTLEGTTNFCIAQSEFNSDCSENEFIKGAIFEFKENLEATEIDDKKTELINDPSQHQYLESSLKQGQLVSSYTRVIIRYASPIMELTTRSNLSDQETLFQEYLSQVYTYIKSIEDTELNVYIYSDALYKYEYEFVINDDSEYMSLAFAWLTISLFISSRGIFVVILAILQMGVAFLAGYMIYSDIFFISDLGPLLIYGAYGIMAVGISNLLIFRDNWRHSKYYLGSEVRWNTRMEWVFKRAIKEVFIMSAIICLAVLPLANTTIYQVRIFLVFIIIMTICLLASSIALYPPLFIFYKKYFAKPFNIVRQLKKHMNLTHQIEIDLSSIEPNTIIVDDEEEYKSLKGGHLEKFFGKVWSKVTLYIGPIILLGLSAYVGFCIYDIIENLSIRTSPEQLLPYKYQTQYALELMRNTFKRGYKDMHANMYIYWGIKDLINTNTTSFSKSRGMVEFDPTFEIEFFKGITLMEICEYCQLIQTSEFISNPQYLSCFALDFTSYLYTLRNIDKYEDECNIYKDFNNLEPLLTKWATTTDQGLAFAHSHEIGITSYKKIQFAYVIFPLKIEPFDTIANINKSVVEAKLQLIEYATSSSNVMVKSSKISGMYHELLIETVAQLKFITILGLSISLIAMLILLIVTICNPLLSFYSAMCLTCIYFSMIPSLDLFDKQFGVIEAIFSLTVPLFSVSPFITVSIEYMLSTEERRRFRLRDALGMSAVTQFQIVVIIIGNTFWLYLCDCIILYKYAIMVLIGVSFSFLFGTFFFPALLNFIGPFRKCCTIPYKSGNKCIKYLDELICKFNRHPQIHAGV